MDTWRESSAIRHVSKEQAIQELLRSVGHLEQVYEMSSEEMAHALDAGRTETADICFWMVAYRQLKTLQNGHR
ncbi:MAG: hypothetical protein ACR2JC_18625 [Chloroflexota bacterium]|nr:MAG: hypothetical protein DLM70_06665 [Chloroflexota bacterium]